MNDEQKAKAVCKIESAWRCVDRGITDIFSEFLKEISRDMKRALIVYADKRKLLVGTLVQLRTGSGVCSQEIDLDVIRTLNSNIKDNHYDQEDLANMERHFSRCLEIVRKARRRYEKQ